MTFKLQVLHASDLEGGVDAIQAAPNFAAIETALEQDAANGGFASITLSAGDNVISGPFFNAASDPNIFNPVFEGFYNELFDLIDAETLDGIQASGTLIDTDGNGFYDNAEIDTFLLGADNVDGLVASDIYTTDVNGDGFFDFFDELDNFQGRVDIGIINAIGFDASALGNHEFDLGTDTLENFIQRDLEEDNSLSGTGEASILADQPGHQNFLQEVDFVGVQFPFLSANLDFTNDPEIGNLFTSEIRDSSEFLLDLGTARVDPSDPTVTGPNSSQDVIAPSTIITVPTDGVDPANGTEQIGVIGATTPLLDAISSPGQVGVLPSNDDIAELAAIIQAEVGRLEALGINKIVLVSHLQQFSIESEELAPLLEGVDIIIAGGSDTISADAEDVERGLQQGDTPDVDYPLFVTGADGNPTAVVSTDGEYSYVGRLVIEFDDNGVLIPESVDPNVSGAFATTDDGVAALYDGSIAGLSDDPFADGTVAETVQDLVNNVTTVVNEQDGNVAGQTDVFLNGARSSVRTEETNFGNLSADASLALARSEDPDVVVSLRNGGGIRDIIGFTGQLEQDEIDAFTAAIEAEGGDPALAGFVDSNGDGVVNADDTFSLPPLPNVLAGSEFGDVSQLSIANTLRFDNDLVAQTLTAEQLFEVLEHAVSASDTTQTDEPGQFPQIAGIRFSFDPNNQARELDPETLEQTVAGERIVNAVIETEDGPIDFIVDGELVSDIDETFPDGIRIVTLDFLQGGGDSYPYSLFASLDPDFANVVELDPVSIGDGEFVFSDPNEEQDALAEFVFDNFNTDNAGAAFPFADTPIDEDQRIQNLAVDTVEDTILEAGNLTSLQGTSDDDDLEGTNGDDTIFGNAGDDEIEGDDGDDNLFGGEGDDEIEGDDGDDFIVGGAGDDELAGDDGDDQLFGGSGDDELEGDDGNDLLVGGEGSDELDGGDGDDILNADLEDEEIDGDDGNDTVVLSSVSEGVVVNLDEQVITGNDSGDEVETEEIENAVGTDFDDTLIGDGGANVLEGAGGDDVLFGSLGDDTLDGGEGSDTVDFSTAEQRVNINLRTGDAVQLTNEEGHITDEGSQVDGNNGFTVTPILTIGETLSSSGALNPNNTALTDDGEVLDPIGEFTPVGILDGLGATRITLEDGTEVVRVFANHELNGGQGNNFEVSDGQGGTFTLDGSRISFFDIDVETKAIVDSGLAFNQIIQPDGEVAQNLDFLPSPSTPFFGGESAPQTGIDRFCSGNLEEGNSFGSEEEGFRGTVDDIYFAGEEDGGGFNSVGGTQFALDISNDSGDGGVIYTLPFFGRGSFENSTQLDTGEGDHVAFIQTDDQSPFDFDSDGENETAAVYLYIGKKSDDPEADFLERNGLTEGKLFVFVPDDPSLDSPLEFNGAGANQAGRWVQVDNRPLDPDAVNAESGAFDPANLPEGGPQEGFPFTLAPSDDGSTGFDEFGFPTQGNLLTQAEALGSFGFSRPEDVATNPTQPNQVVIASTGVDTFDVDPETGNGADTFGTLYTLDVAFDGLDFDALFAGEDVEIAANLAVLYDGDEDPTRAIRSPDNLDFTEDGRIIVQEDEAEEDTLSGDEILFGPPSDDPDGPILANPLEAGILILDPAAGPEALSQGLGITRVATVDRGGVIDPSVIAPTTAFDEDLVGVPNVSFNGVPDGGEAETSGVIDVSSLFDEAPGTLFLADTQFHGIEDQDALNPNSRINVEDLEEGGQIFFISQDDAVGDISDAINRDELISIENAIGSEFDDEITGSAGDNILEGRGGDDVIVGLQGTDTIDGGAGDDIIALIDTVDDGETIDGGEGGDAAGDTDTLLLTSLLEGVTVDLDVANQGVFLPEAPSQEGTITGTDTGNVTLISEIENVVGTENDDVIFGNNEANDINAGGGDDSVHGFGGADTLDGGEGIDTLLVTGAGAGQTINLAEGTAGPDTIANFENVTGSGFDDDITGDDGDNILIGGAGNDFITGGAGNDELNGGIGENIIELGAGISDQNLVIAGSGVDTILNFDVDGGGESSFDTLEFFFDDETVSLSTTEDFLGFVTALSQSDLPTSQATVDGTDLTFTFSNTADSGSPISTITLIDIVNDDLTAEALSAAGAVTLITGTEEADSLQGTPGDDIILGLGGDDTLIGNGGFDVLDGGEGIDTADFSGSETGIFADVAAGSVIANGGNVAFTAEGTDTAEIVAFDAESQQLFVAGGAFIDVFDGEGNLIVAIPVDTEVTSVAVSNGLLAAAVPADPETDPGTVFLFNIADIEEGVVPEPAATFTVGSLPDALTFTPDGSKILVANEGEADDGVDPEGSISIIDLASETVLPLDFNAFDADEDALIAEGLLIFGQEDGEDVTVSQDIEPEFIAVAPDGSQAFVTLQENNAVAIVDLSGETPEITDIVPLGTRDLSVEGNGIDGANDDIINIAPIDNAIALFQPDAITSFEIGGQTFFATANEGDARDFDEFNLEDVTLDPTIFPNAAELQDDDTGIGNLEVSQIVGDTDGDGDVDQIAVFGGRSFSILDDQGNTAFESGNTLETILAEQFPLFFNDNRSDDAGPEPEAVAIGEVDGETILFVGLERSSGVLAFTISEGAGEAPLDVEFKGFVAIAPEGGFPLSEDLDDLTAPEGLLFVPAADSPTGEDLLFVSDEEVGKTFGFNLALGSSASATLIDIENVTGSDFDDQISGDAGANELNGLDGNDLLQGQGGNDTILGGDGDDIILGGGGSDFTDGGEGIDTVSFEDIGFEVEASLDDGEATYSPASGVLITDTLIDFENLVGSNFDDELEGDRGDNVIEGLDGDDDIDGGRGDDTLLGGDGDDDINGGSGADTLSGGDGDDFLRGGTGDDNLLGGDGDDRLAGNSGDDDLSGGGGDDRLAGNSGDDDLSGGDGDDFLRGGTGDDNLLGGDGDDRLAGNSGDDDLSGGGGDDRLAGNSGDDDLSGGGGDDNLFGGSGQDDLDGGDGEDNLFGGAGRDIISGGDGDDRLFGNRGQDTLIGGEGEDLLIGGSGRDTAVFFGSEDDFEVSGGRRVQTVTNLETGETDTLISIENIVFDDPDIGLV